MIKEPIKGSPTVSLIIPVYNSIYLVNKNLPEIIKAKENPANKIIEIIVVDDASTDGSSTLIKREFREVKLIRHTKSRGLAAAINTGARSSKGKILVLMDVDIIPADDFLKEALLNFRTPGVFAVSLNERQPAGMQKEEFYWSRGYFKNGYVGQTQVKSFSKIHETFWINGKGAIYRRDYWMRLGGMDEKLYSPLFWEDIDLSYRAAKRGLINLWDSNAIVIRNNDSKASRFDESYLKTVWERNRLLFHWKNITSLNLFRKHVLGIFKRLISQPGYLKIVIMALWRLRIALKSRWKELREVKVADEAILAKFQNDNFEKSD